MLDLHVRCGGLLWGTTAVHLDLPLACTPGVKKPCSHRLSCVIANQMLSAAWVLVLHSSQPAQQQLCARAFELVLALEAEGASSCAGQHLQLLNKIGQLAKTNAC